MLIFPHWSECKYLLVLFGYGTYREWIEWLPGLARWCAPGALYPITVLSLTERVGWWKVVDEWITTLQTELPGPVGQFLQHHFQSTRSFVTLGRPVSGCEYPVAEAQRACRLCVHSYLALTVGDVVDEFVIRAVSHSDTWFKGCHFVIALHTGVVYVACRGTANIADLSVDMLLNTEDMMITINGSPFHVDCVSGYQARGANTLPRLVEYLMTVVTKQPHPVDIVLSGHSLGAACVNSLVFLLFSDTGRSSFAPLFQCVRRVMCITFGEPPTGSRRENSRALEHLHQTYPNFSYFSTVNNTDLVPRLRLSAAAFNHRCRHMYVWQYHTPSVLYQVQAVHLDDGLVQDSMTVLWKHWWSVLRSGPRVILRLLALHMLLVCLTLMDHHILYYEDMLTHLALPP
jgi:hypothetical protein